MISERCALYWARRWWRPIMAWGFTAGVWAATVVHPLMTGQQPSLTGLATLGATVSAIYLARAAEKKWGDPDA